MDDLFEKLKSEKSINENYKKPTSCVTTERTEDDAEKCEAKENGKNTSQRTPSELRTEKSEDNSINDKFTTSTKSTKDDKEHIEESNASDSIVKFATPTKAQQKLFDPALLQQLKHPQGLKIKRCLVRLPRMSLTQLNQNLAKHKMKTTTSEPSTRKRKNSNVPASSPPKAKKPRQTISNGDGDLSPTKGFFIKLNTPVKAADKNNRKLIPVKSTVKKYATAKAIAPTKFTRTHLIKSFGIRPFRSYVRIERCAHPLMRIFESNARALKKQSKSEKSKNLSVSFREQVEILGGSDDSEPESDTSINLLPSTSQSALQKPNSDAAMPIMPARLKRVENGKVIADIELDASLFIDPAKTVSSTPFVKSPNKRREKKSYSPLKDDNAYSPQKERLKLANEKLPPSGLRRLNIDDLDDEDDEDVEYIVPNELPPRRASAASSTNVSDPGTCNDVNSPTNSAKISPAKIAPDSDTSIAAEQSDKDVTNSNSDDSIKASHADSSGSFVSAEESVNEETKSNGTKQNELVNDEKVDKAETSSNDIDADKSKESMSLLDDLKEKSFLSRDDVDMLGANDAPFVPLDTLDDLVDFNCDQEDDLDDDAVGRGDIHKTISESITDSPPLNLYVDDNNMHSASTNLVNAALDQLTEDIEMAELLTSSSTTSTNLTSTINSTTVSAKVTTVFGVLNQTTKVRVE